MAREEKGGRGGRDGGERVDFNNPVAYWTSKMKYFQGRLDGAKMELLKATDPEIQALIAKKLAAVSAPTVVEAPKVAEVVKA